MPAAAAAAVSERGGWAQGARAGRVPELHPLRAGRSSARCCRSRSKRPEPGRFRVADRARARGSGQRPPEAPELSLPEFPEPPAEAAQPRIPNPALAKIARGRISTSQRADQAGQLGSSPRPTAEGPGSGRARRPGCLQAPLSRTLPP